MAGMNLTELNARDMRKIYMITHSQVIWENVLKIFPEFFLKAFDFEKSTVKPMYWEVCKEAHQIGGIH